MTKLTQQEIEKEREAFEAWYLGEYIKNKPISELQKDSGGEYFIEFIEREFNTWLARAELAKGGE